MPNTTPTVSVSTPEQIAQDETVLGGYAYQIIRQQSKRIFKLRSPVLADTDPENLHQMRIGTRRLNAALALFSDVIASDADATQKSEPQKSIVKESKAVKRLTKSLGKARDLDVMQQWFEQALSTANSTAQETDSKIANETNSTAATSLSKKEKKTVRAILKTVEKRRRKQFAKLEKTLNSKKYKKLARHFKRWIKQPVFSSVAQQSAKDDAIQRIVMPITHLLKHPGWLLASRLKNNQPVPVKRITLAQVNQQLEADGELLHDLRKQVKQLRYQTEFFRGLYDITYAAQIREFRMFQTILGQLQDQLVVSEFLTGELGEDWPAKLPSINAEFQNSRLDLWKQWQPYQRKYLKLRSKLPADFLTA